jgi:hypothetical protein
MLGGAWLSHLAVKWLAVWTKKNYLSKLSRSTQAAFSPALVLPKFQGWDKACKSSGGTVSPFPDGRFLNQTETAQEL